MWQGVILAPRECPLKLTATFYNNLAVGAAIAGLVVPYLAIYPTFFSADYYSEKAAINLSTALSMGIAALICCFCRSGANAWIAKLVD
jgi:hypothetical protein